MTLIDVGSRYWRYVAEPSARAAPVIVAVAVVVALSVGWLQSDEEYLTPESGLGYWLGIVGGAMMLLLLFYSFRKRRASQRGFGTIPTWFRIHMMLGVTGPVLIAFHSNFRLGALNSNVALFAMLSVAISGVIGRYIYGRIHMGLYGRKAVARDILADLAALREEFKGKNDVSASIFDELDEFGRRIIERPATGAVESLFVVAEQATRSMSMRLRLREEMQCLAEKEGNAKEWSWWRRRRRASELTTVMNGYFNAVLKAAELRFYERLFAQWHVLHLPLFFLMIMAAFIHVWAVHKYQ